MNSKAILPPKTPPSKSPYLVPLVRLRPSTPRKPPPKTPPPPGAEDNSCFGLLPVEVKIKIFDKFDFEQRKILRLVCPSWRAIVNDTLVYRASVDNPAQSWLANCSCNHFKSLHVQNWKTELVRGVPQPFVLPQIEHLTIGKGNSEQNVLLLLRTHVTKSLTLKNWALSQVTKSALRNCLPDFRIDGIHKLSLTIGCPNFHMQCKDQYRQNIDALLFVLKSVNFKTLKTLSWSLNWVKSTHVDLSLWKPAFEIISLSFTGKYKPSIKELNVTLLGILEGIAPRSPAFRKEVHREWWSLRLQKFSMIFDEWNIELAQLLLLKLPVCLTSLKLEEPQWFCKNDTRTHGDYLHSSKNRLVFKKIGPNLRELELRLVSFSFDCLEYFQRLDSLDLQTTILDHNEYRDLMDTNSPKLRPLLALRKFTLTTKYHQGYDYSLTGLRSFPRRLISRINIQFPNIEDMELILLGGYEVSDSVLKTIFRIPNIRRLKIGYTVYKTSGFSPPMHSLINKFKKEPGIRVLDKKTADLMGSEFEYVEFGINTLNLPQHLRPAAAAALPVSG